jgi:hypothetical protein
VSQPIRFRLNVDVEDEGLGVPLLRVGEEITGSLEAEGELQGLSVELLWQAHGKGSPESHVLSTVTAGPPQSGPWSTHFTFRIPDTGPLSYDGENVKVAWFLQAKADTGALFGGGHQEKYPLLVMPRSEAGAGGDVGTHRHTSDTNAAWFLILFGILFGGIPGFIGVVMVASGEFFPAIFLSIFVLIGGGLFVWGVAQLMGNRLLQDAYLETPRADTFLGEQVPFKVGGIARSAFRLDKLVIKHVCTEAATRHRGTDSTTYSKQVFEQEIVFEPAREYRAGEAFVFEGEFRMPEDAPATLDGRNNDLTWKFTAAFDVPNWPDPDLSWSVPMRPVLAAEVFEGQEEATYGEG